MKYIEILAYDNVEKEYLLQYNPLDDQREVQHQTGTETYQEYIFLVCLCLAEAL
jgi:hypothetical protein